MDEPQDWSQTQSSPIQRVRLFMHTRVTRATTRKSLLSSSIEETSTSQWVAAQRNFSQRQKVAIDKIIAISCWSFVAMALILFEHGRNWKMFQHGGGQSFSAFSVV